MLVQIGLSVGEGRITTTKVEVAQLARINRRYTGSADGGANPMVIIEMGAWIRRSPGALEMPDIMCMCVRLNLRLEYISQDRG